MPARFGGTPIGGMQYNGHTIAEAMIDGQIVYRSVIRITAPAPTFLDVPPWLVLPEAEGVTYTVLGNVAPGQPVEVHATAEEGYELEGVTQWWRTITDYDPQETYFGMSGVYDYQVPPWANHIDVICLGGGGAGGSGTGTFANAGSGGNAGAWGLARIFVSDLPSRDLRVTVGNRGLASTAADTKGGNGQPSVVRDAHSGQGIGIQGGGGIGGGGGTSAGTNGGSPGSRSYQGKTYSGGAGGAYADSRHGGNGSPPGGGGGGFFGNYWRGGHGANGGVWITAYVEGD